MTETQTVAGLFEQMESNFKSDKAGSMDATFQFEISGDDGGNWWAKVADGNCSITEGTSDSPTVTIKATSTDWINIVNGSLNPQMAFMQGKLKVQGDLGLATKLGTLFL